MASMKIEQCEHGVIKGFCMTCFECEPEGGRRGMAEQNWQPIETMPQAIREGAPFRVYAPSLVDPDFNPSGSAEACYDPEERIIAAKWDGQHDVWATVFVDDATHWMPLPDPPSEATLAADARTRDRG